MPQVSVRQSASSRRCWKVVPSTGAAVITIGNAAVTVTGTLTQQTLASTNLLTSVRATLFSSGTTAGTVASVRDAQTEFWRGNATGLGGFYFRSRFGLNTLQSGNRAFVGITDVTTAPTNVDPTTSTAPGKAGMAINANTGNWQFVANVTGSAPTVTDLGANFAVNTTSLFQLEIFCGSNDSAISYEITNLSTGNKIRASVTTNIPASTTFLTISAWITNNATAAAAILVINEINVETIY
jgi:hypothetical protein